MKKIVIITTGQPSVNPRVVKEADALHAAGHNVTVLYCFWIQWAEEADKVLLQKVKWNYRLIGGSATQNKLLYFLTRARFKINRSLNRKLGNRYLLAERSQARCYDELLAVARSTKADWYIGHNLGALSIAVKAARYNHASAGFDFEDYHRGENANTPKHELKRLVFLEEKYVPALGYISVSSALIRKMVEQHFPLFSKPVVTLVNSFPLSQQPAFRHKASGDPTLRLFWFSQTIGKDRGLEALIESLEKLNDTNIYLTLAGRCNDDMKEYIHHHAVKVLKNIEFAGIKQPEELPTFAAGFDVGLALETGFSTNNGIALTNKIFTYLLAGNAVILSDTPMQKLFNEKYNLGETFTPYDSAGLAEKILLFKNRNKLDAQRLHNYELSKNELNWDNESKKLLTIFS